MCAEAALPHPRGALPFFPAKMEAKREATKAWQARPGNQTSSRCLVRSLVSLAGCFPHLLASRPCPLQPWVGAVGVRGASVRTRRCPQGCLAQGPTPKNRSEKSRPRIPLRRANAKSSKTMVFELAVGFKKFCRRRKNGVCSRALSPPRLAAGAGDRNTETLKDFYVLGLLEAISERFVFGTEPSGSRAPQMNLKLHLG